MDDELIIPLSIVIFLATIIFSVVMSVILNYHWNRYEPRNWRLRFMQGIYFLVSTILFLLMAGLAALFLKQL